MKCKSRHPPGDEIYRDGAVSIFEVDGRRNKVCCGFFHSANVSYFNTDLLPKFMSAIENVPGP